MKIYLTPKFLISLIISSTALFFSFKDFDFNNFLAIIDNARLFYIFLPCLLLIFSVWVRAIRWKFLIPKNEKITVKDLFELEMVGFFGNNIFPMRFGEIHRIFLLSKIFGLSKTSSAGSVFFERILDIFGLLVLSQCLFFYPINYELKKYILLSVFILLISLFLFLVFKNKIRKTNNIIIKDFFQSLNNLQSKNIKKILLLSIFIWMIFLLNIHLIQFSLDIGLSIFDSLFILLLSTFAIAIPAAPGMIGTFHFAVSYSMKFLGFEIDISNAFAILLHAYGFLTFIFIGLFYFLKFQTYNF